MRLDYIPSSPVHIGFHIVLAINDLELTTFDVISTCGFAETSIGIMQIVQRVETSAMWNKQWNVSVTTFCSSLMIMYSLGASCSQLMLTAFFSLMLKTKQLEHIAQKLLNNCFANVKSVTSPASRLWRSSSTAVVGLETTIGWKQQTLDLLGVASNSIALL